MRFSVFITLAYLAMQSVSAQSRQQQRVDSVFQILKTFFNQKNADAIYNLAGEDFQKELSIDAFNDVSSKQLFPLGAIEESSLISFVNNSDATYKLKFASVVLQLQMNLDKRDKLQLFLFQTYVDPGSNKKELVATSNPLRTDDDRKIDSVARNYIQKATTVGLVVGTYKNGKTTTYGYGETKKGSRKLPDENNFFELGSITKTFTATLLAWYVNAGKVKLTDPITNYLPDSVSENPGLKNITLLNLANHTSGLARIPDNLLNHAPDLLNPYKDYNRQLMYAYLQTCKLESRPGEKYAYSNLAFGLLGDILQEVSREPFEQMVNEVICKPLGMFSTSQYLNPLLSPRFVAVYNQNGYPTEAWDFDVLASCGALRSTVNDMLTYLKANMRTTNTALAKAFDLTHKLTFNKDIQVGLGWHTMIINDVGFYFHDGGTYGSSSFIAFNPKKNIAVIILSNSAESVNAVGMDILKKIE